MHSVLMGATVYLALLIFTRVTGRRTLAQSTVFDMILILILAETTQNVLLRDDWSVTNFIVLLATLGTLDIALSFLKLRFPAAERWIDGEPTVLMRNGIPDDKVLARSRIDKEDILESARMKHGIGTLKEIDAAVLEAGGGISILPRKAEDPSG